VRNSWLIWTAVLIFGCVGLFACGPGNRSTPVARASPGTPTATSAVASPTPPPTPSEPGKSPRPKPTPIATPTPTPSATASRYPSFFQWLNSQGFVSSTTLNDVPSGTSCTPTVRYKPPSTLPPAQLETKSTLQSNLTPPPGPHGSTLVWNVQGDFSHVNAVWTFRCISLYGDQVTLMFNCDGAPVTSTTGPACDDWWGPGWKRPSPTP